MAYGHFDNVQRWSDPAPAGRGRGRTPPVLRGHDAGLVQLGFVLRPERLFVQSAAQSIPVRSWIAGKTRDGAKKKNGKRRRFQRISRPKNRLCRNSKIKGVPSARMQDGERDGRFPNCHVCNAGRSDSDREAALPSVQTVDWASSLAHFAVVFSGFLPSLKWPSIHPLTASSRESNCLT